jgi:hypothetical protein
MMDKLPYINKGVYDIDISGIRILVIILQEVFSVNINIIYQLF